MNATLTAIILVINECSMQRDPIVSKCSELLRLGLMPSASEIRAGKASHEEVIRYARVVNALSCSRIR